MAKETKSICEKCRQSDYNENDVLFCTKTGVKCFKTKVYCENFIKEK